MDYYIEILIKPDDEMRWNVLLNTIYTKFHKALCDIETHSIGISFPKFRTTLGDMLRIHGSKEELENLQRLDWIGGMIGYCKVSEILPVPEGSKFRRVSRKQTTMSNAKLERLKKRGSITEEEVKRYKAKLFSRGLAEPYLELVSKTNGHKHRRYIEISEILDGAVTGQFDKFGLSRSATVPWF